MSKLAKNSLLYLAATLFLKGSSFLLLPLFTNLISPEDYGTIYLLTTTGSFLTVLFSLSIRGAVSRFYFDNKSPDAVKTMYSTIVLFIGLFTLVVYTLLYLFSNSLSLLMEIDKPLYMKMALIASFLSIFYPLISSLLQAQERGKIISLVSISTGFFALLLQLILVINMDNKVEAYMTFTVIHSLVTFLLFIVFSREFFSFSFCSKKLKEYIKYSLQILPGELSAWILTFADRIMIKKYKGSEETGLYSIGYKIGQAPDILFHAINQAYVPHVFNAFSEWNKESEKKLVTIATYLFTLFTGTIFLLIVFTGEITMILADAYEDSLWIIVIILGSYLFAGYKFIFHNPMSYNKEFAKYKSYIWIFTAILNVVLNVILIPRYSMYGAALATFIAYVVTLIPVLFFSHKAIKIHYPVKKYILILFISLLYSANIFMELTPVTLLIKIAATVAYIIFLVKMSELDVKYYSGLLINKIRKKGLK